MRERYTSGILFRLGLFIATFAVLQSSALAQNSFYVSTSGTAAGDGSRARPWDWRTAFAHPPSVLPGDIIWFDEGEYRATGDGIMYPRFLGTEAKPIIVRAMPGKRVTLVGDLSCSNRISHAWIWGFELWNRGVFNTTYDALSGMSAHNPDIKFINNIVHDTESVGIALWRFARGSEAYGNIVYNNGVDANNRGHGHGFYIQSLDDLPYRHVIENNVGFRNFNKGIQLSGETAGRFKNTTIKGNTFFNNGEMATGKFSHNWVIAPKDVAPGLLLMDNLGYGPPRAPAQYYAASLTDGAIITGNVNVSPGPTSQLALQLNSPVNLTMTGNTFYGAIAGFTQSQYPQNTYLSARPTTNWVYVRGNKYEPGRAFITVYNWSGASSVSVDISTAGLQSNQEFEVRDTQNYYGPVVYSGRYTGAQLTLPMSGLPIAAPIGPVPVQPVHTAPEFNVFVIVPKVSSGNIDTVPPAAPSNLRAD